MITLKNFLPLAETATGLVAPLRELVQLAGKSDHVSCNTKPDMFGFHETVALPGLPRATLSDEFLRATNRTRQGYLGALPQNQISLTLNTNIEAKLPSNTRDRERLEAAFEQLALGGVEDVADLRLPIELRAGTRHLDSISRDP